MAVPRLTTNEDTFRGRQSVHVRHYSARVALSGPHIVFGGAQQWPGRGGVPRAAPAGALTHSLATSNMCAISRWTPRGGDPRPRRLLMISRGDRSSVIVPARLINF